MGEPTYKLVPMEPTPGMIAAADEWNEPQNIYRAMLAAAPAAPAGEPVAQPLTDEQIKQAVFAKLREWKDDRAWDKFTRESGPYDVPALRVEVLEICKAVLAAAHPPGEQAAGASEQALREALLEAQRAINGMKVDAENIALICEDNNVIDDLSAISQAGLDADTAIRAALAAHPPAPAQPTSEVEEMRQHGSQDDYIEALAAAEGDKHRAAAPAPQERDALKPTKGGTNDRKGH